MTGPPLLDSSVWFAYLHKHHPEAVRIIDSERIVLTSVLSLFEVKRKLLQMGVPAEQRENILELMRRRSMLFDVDGMLAESAAELSAKHHLSMADSLIYATARARDAELITGDADFAKLKGVRLLK